MAVSGVCLAFHFGLWVSATQQTSLPHALLLVSATPVALAVWALVQRVPLSRGEIAGTAAAMLGMVILVSDAHSDTQVSLRGDFEALGAATVFAVYLTIGGELRGWMPLFLYAVPVNGMAGATLCSVGLLFEGAVPWGAGRRGIFGYLTKGRYAAVSIYLAGSYGVTPFGGAFARKRAEAPVCACPRPPPVRSPADWRHSSCRAPRAWHHAAPHLMSGVIPYAAAYGPQGGAATVSTAYAAALAAAQQQQRRVPVGGAETAAKAVQQR